MSDAGKSAVAGRQTRFAGLLREHQGILNKVAFGYCRQAGERRDLVQEMAAQAWRGFARYDERVRFSTWLYRVALNTAISFYRREGLRVRGAQPLEGLEVEQLAAPAEPESDSLRLLRELIARLDPINRALVTLYLDGESHAAIAEIIGLSATNVGTRLGRLKERLKRELEAAQPAEQGG